MVPIAAWRPEGRRSSVTDACKAAGCRARRSTPGPLGLTSLATPNGRSRLRSTRASTSTVGGLTPTASGASRISPELADKGWTINRRRTAWPMCLQGSAGAPAAPTAVVDQARPRRAANRGSGRPQVPTVVARRRVGATWPTSLRPRRPRVAVCANGNRSAVPPPDQLVDERLARRAPRRQRARGGCRCPWGMAVGGTTSHPRPQIARMSSQHHLEGGRGGTSSRPSASSAKEGERQLLMNPAEQGAGRQETVPDAGASAPPARAQASTRYAKRAVAD